MNNKFYIKNLNSFVNNSAFLYLYNFSDYLITFFLLPFIVRALGAEEFGKIGLAQTFGILIVLIIEFGSPLVSTREIAKIKNKSNGLLKYIGEIITFKILLIPLTFLITFIAISFIPIFTSNPEYILIVLIGSIFQGLSPVWYFQGIEKIGKIIISKIMIRLLGFVAVIFFVDNPRDGWIFLTSISMTNFFVCVAMYKKMINDIGLFRLVNFKNLGASLKQNFHSFLISIFPVIYQNITSIMLSFFVSPLQLGVFYGMSKIYRAFNTLFGPISQAVFPIISKVSNKNQIESKLLIKKYLTLIITIGILFMIIIYIFSEQIITLILGENFSSGTLLLKLFSFVLPLTAISNALGRQWLMAKNKDSFYLLTQFLSSIAAFLTFYYAIKKFDILSIPISLIVFELVTIFLIALFLLRNEKYRFI